MSKISKIQIPKETYRIIVRRTLGINDNWNQPEIDEMIDHCYDNNIQDVIKFIENRMGWREK